MLRNILRAKFGFQNTPIIVFNTYRLSPSTKYNYCYANVDVALYTYLIKER